MPKSLVEQCSETIQKMLGYSIHSAFMGYVVVRCYRREANQEGWSP